MDSKVRQALNLAIDKTAISAVSHFGFSRPVGSIFHSGAFGTRFEERVNQVSSFDPERAKELLREANFGAGFSVEGHFGRFTGRPGIPEAAEAIEKSWKSIGVTVTWMEHDPSVFVRGFRPRLFSHIPLSLQPWGRQDHSAAQASLYGSASSFIGVYNERSEELYADILSTYDATDLVRKLALFEDEILGLEETFPIYAMSVVNAYTDRVVAHPTVEYSSHFKHYDLVELKD